MFSKREIVYREILKLKAMLEEAGIPFEIRPLDDGYQICYPSLDWVCSVLQTKFSYGSSSDRLEIMSKDRTILNEPDGVAGWLTAEQVFELIKSHYQPEEDCCGNCKYFIEDSLEHEGVVDFCARFPEWVEVYTKDHWCGEHKRKE